MTGPHEDWTKVPFWSLFRRDKRTGFPDEELLSVYREYGVIRKADRDDNWNRPGENMSSYQLVEEGDLVLNKMKTWQGSLGISPHRGIVSPAYFVYKSASDNDPRFLHHALRSQFYIDQYAQISKGVRIGQWDLQPEKLDAMLVSLPPIDQQRQLAEFLDRETAEIDAMDAELNHLIATLRERQAQTAEEAFSRLEAREGPVGAVVLNQWSGKSVNGYSNAAQESEVGVLKTSAVSSGSFRPSQNKQVVEADLKLVRAPVNAGDVIVGRANSPELVGAAVLVQTDHPNLYLSDKLWGLDLACDQSYFVHWTRTQWYQSQVRESLVGSSSSMQNLSLAHFLRFRMPLPSIAEQLQIAHHLDEQTARVDDMIADANRLKTLLAERRSTLITEVVTGKKEVPA